MMHKPKAAFHNTSDPQIITRVKQYLEENVHQTYVDVTVMAKQLQERYQEYQRRKTVPFRQQVEQAYKTVLHSYGLDSNPSSDNDEELNNSDLELMEEGPSANHMNNTITNMYMAKNKGPASGNDELIDISSDDDEDGGGNKKSSGEKTQNSVSTTTAAHSASDKQKPFEPMQQLSTNHQITVTKVNREHEIAAAISTTNNGTTTTATNKKPATSPAGSSSGTAQVTKKRKVDNPPPEMNGVNLQNKEPFSTLVEITPVNGTTIPTKKTESQKPTKSDGGEKRLKRYKKEVVETAVNFNFKDVGGMDKILKDLCELLLHVKHPEIYRHIGLPPPRGFLLHGPPGTGKTLLARAIAGQLNVGLIEVPATELVAGISGESEERIREVFEQAAELAPCVLFIDEIDSISSNRMNAQKDMERRIVSQLLSCLDGLSKYKNGDQVLVIGATNRVEALDPALRRVGRFDQEISLGIPDREARVQILKIICKNLKIDNQLDYEELAMRTPGYVGADLMALATRAATTAVKRAFVLKDYDMFSRNTVQCVDLLDESAIMDIDDDRRDDDVVDLDDEIEKVSDHGKDKNDDVVAVDDEEVVNLDDDTTIDGMADKVVEEILKAQEKPTEKVDKSEEQPVVETMDITSEAEAQVSDVTTENKDTEAEQEKVKEKPSEIAEDVEMATADSSSIELLEPIKLVEPAVAEPILAATEEKPVEKPVEIPEEIKDKVEDEVKIPDTETKEPEQAPAIEECVQKSQDVQAPEVIEEDVPKPVEIVEKPAEKVQKKVLTLANMIEWLDKRSPPLAQNELLDLCITTEDFLDSLKHVQPSAKREGFITVPDVTWEDIGSLNDIREELKLAILAPVKYPLKLKSLGLTTPSGVLLCGPPGCGKTLLAKAVANEAGINFISVKGPELLNMYVGESERAVRQCFQRARNSTPCVIFFDEFDSLCPKRSDSAEGGSGMRVVNQLLTEMDGIEERQGVFLMAATNRPDIVDPAVLRPGRLDKILYVGLPDENDRDDILKALTKNGTKPPVADDVVFREIAHYTVGYTGADLAGLVRQASLQSLKSSIVTDATDNTDYLTVQKSDFIEAFKQIKPSVNEEDKKHYEKLKLKYGSSCGMNN